MIIELDIDVEYDYQPPEKMTRHYPGCPEAVVITNIEILNCPINEGLFDAIMNEHGDEIEQWCLDDAHYTEQERLVAEAENRNDWEEDR